MHFGETDASIPMTDVDAIRAAQPKVDSYVYRGAGHGFGCDERGCFSKPDYELAQQRTQNMAQHQTSQRSVQAMLRTELFCDASSEADAAGAVLCSRHCMSGERWPMSALSIG